MKLSLGFRYMAASAFCFSIMSVLVKLAGQRLPTQEIVMLRSTLVALICWAMLRAAGIDVRGNRRRLLLVRGFIGFLALSCFFYAVVHLPLADATVIQYTNPAFTALIAVWFLGERIGAREALAVGAALVAAASGVAVARSHRWPPPRRGSSSTPSRTATGCPTVSRRSRSKPTA